MAMMLNFPIISLLILQMMEKKVLLMTGRITKAIYLLVMVNTLWIQMMITISMIKNQRHIEQQIAERVQLQTNIASIYERDVRGQIIYNLVFIILYL
jgi:hypothetical protein